jgi:hypothetical protein
MFAAAVKGLFCSIWSNGQDTATNTTSGLMRKTLAKHERKNMTPLNRENLRRRPPVVENLQKSNHSEPEASYSIVSVGHGGSFPTEVRRVLFHIRIRMYQSSFGLYHHFLGTPVGGQFLMYIRALRATLNKPDHSFNSVSLSIS